MKNRLVQAAVFSVAAAAALGAAVPASAEKYPYKLIEAVKCRLQEMNEDGTGGGLICDGYQTARTAAGAGDCLSTGGSVSRMRDGEVICWAPADARPVRAGRSARWDSRAAGACVRGGRTATLRAGQVVCTPTPAAAYEFYVKVKGR